MKSNTTGLPDTGDYLLGRGRIYVAVLDETTGLPNSSGWRDLGNSPSVSFNVTEETLQHRSSRSGTATVDKEVPISKTATLTFQLDELNAQNVALFLGGTLDTYTNPAVAGFAEINIWITNVVLGNWYDLTDATTAGIPSGNRLMGITAGNVTLEKDAAMDVPLVLGTDYELDVVWGRVRFLSTAVNCATGDEINFAYAADAGAPTPIARIKALQQTSQRVALKFISVNPANNDEEAEIEFHQVIPKADGDFAMIGDEFAVLGFTCALEANNTGYASSPFLTISTHSES